MASSHTVASAKYPYPVEVNVRDFVPINLSNGNYYVWKKLMLRLIKSQGLFGFINDEVSAPCEKITVPDDDYSSTKEMENQDYQDYWKRSDALLQRWIIETTRLTSEDVLPHLVGLKTAKDMWSNLITQHERKIEYPYPAEINVRDFVPIKLSKDNYFRWKTLMLDLIESQGLLGFINGEVSEPPEWIEVPCDDDDSSTNNTKKIKNEDYQDWKRLDTLLQKWITETINEDVLPHVKCLKTGRDMWSKLIILREGKIDINVTDFVPIKLSSDNYSIWKSLMLRFIKSQGLLGLINGEVSKRSFSWSTSSDDESDNVNDESDNVNDEWRRSDELLQIWIKKTINEDIRRELVLLETSKDIWERLIILHETNTVYPYPIEVNVGDFVPVKLSGSSNYATWRKLMLHLFEEQGLLGFISPQHQDNKELRSEDDSLAWKRTDALLQSWITRTINENVLACMVDWKTASDMWKELQSLCTPEEYPYPEEVNVGNFVPVKLSRENYSEWEKMMGRLIKTQGLVGFINGQVPAPPRRIGWVENPNYKAWKRTDELLRSWIMGTINQKQVVACEHLETAHDMLTKLAKIFTSKSSYKRRTPGDVKGHISKITNDSTDEEEEEEEDDEQKNVTTDEEEEVQEEAEDAIRQYLPLHKAALTGDWKRAKEFIQQKPDAVRAFLTRKNETALMIAVRSKKGNHFVKELLEFMSLDDVALRDNILGLTALHNAAIAGNTDAAKFLVDKNPDLPNSCSYKGFSPLFVAAIYGRREMIRYLLNVTKDDIHPKPFEGENGSKLVQNLILSGLYDITLSLIKRFPELAWEQPSPALQIIAINCSSAFKSGAHLKWWQRLIFSYVPTKLEGAHQSCGGDVENPINISFMSVKQKLHHVLWKVTLRFVPQMKYIQGIKLKQEEALELVKHLCCKSLESNNSKVRKIIQDSLLGAANSGIPEIVEEIIEAFPELVYHVNEMSQNIFHIAILNRSEDVFNLIYQFREEVRNLILTDKDSNKKSCLDLVLDLKREQKINLRASAAGAALQMQRELQWFKEVEKHTIDYYKEYRSKERTTSGRTYTESHEELIKEGEKWMKHTATSCTFIATLVATVVFAAAISVPGGNDDFGIPNLFQDTAFTFFIISDAIALFSSISSLLMFLAILTSRYSVTDFLFKLPNRLIIGLLFLFVSLTSTMIAFAATLYLLFENKGGWILFPIIGLSCFPVTVFVYSQFPLLWDMMTSTYGPGIFRQQSDRILF